MPPGHKDKNKYIAKQIPVEIGFESDYDVEVISNEFTDNMKVISDILNIKNGQEIKINEKWVNNMEIIKANSIIKKFYVGTENELEILFSETLKIQNNTGSKIYNKSQTKRTDFLARKSVLILMSINRIHPLKLSNNWFQKDDLLIEQILIEVKKTYPSEYDIALQIIDQYY